MSLGFLWHAVFFWLVALFVQDMQVLSMPPHCCSHYPSFVSLGHRYLFGVVDARSLASEASTILDWTGQLYDIQLVLCILVCKKVLAAVRRRNCKTSRQDYCVTPISCKLPRICSPQLASTSCSECQAGTEHNEGHVLRALAETSLHRVQVSKVLSCEHLVRRCSLDAVLGDCTWRSAGKWMAFPSDTLMKTILAHVEIASKV